MRSGRESGSVRAVGVMPGRRRRGPCALGLSTGLLWAGLLWTGLLWAGAALAQQRTPFGIGGAGGPPAPVEPGPVAWLLQQQAAFHKALTAAIATVEVDPAALLALVGLAFAYGVLHAVGPGHGKAVIASYLVANERALRRGIALSFGAAFVQAAIALSVVGLVAGLMGGTAATMNATVDWVERGGFALILAMGLWIALRKARALASPAGAPAQACDADCGHDHGGDPRRLARAGPRELVLTAIGAGIRPCSGAIILLVFALAKGLFFAGALSVAAMAVGTAIGTSAFAALAVKAKVVALNLISGGTDRWRRLSLGVECAAGLVLAALGAALLAGAMGGAG